MSEKRRGLGRGLGALIPSAPATPKGDRPVDVFFADRPSDAAQEASPTPEDAAQRTQASDVSRETASVETSDVEASDRSRELVPVPGAHFAELPVTSIDPNPRQPRQIFDEEDMAELVHSIAEIGVLQPVVVRPSPDQPERYELIMGERRWRASTQAGLDVIPAIIRDTAENDLLRDALLENLHRSQLNPLEEAAAYAQLLEDFGCTHEELAGRIGRSRPQITNTLRLLKLPPLVQRRVAAGVLSAGHARALLGLSDAAAIERLAQRIVAEGLSVRAVEETVALGGDDEPVRRRKPRPGTRHPQLDDLAARLSDRFDTRVKIALGQRRGKLTVEFATVEDLNRIVALLAPDEPQGS